jgi:predicted MFS family arabinose efflux permease
MAFYGYIAPVAERIAGFSASHLTWVLVIVGLGLATRSAAAPPTRTCVSRLSCGRPR